MTQSHAGTLCQPGISTQPLSPPVHYLTIHSATQPINTKKRTLHHHRVFEPGMSLLPLHPSRQPCSRVGNGAQATPGEVLFFSFSLETGPHKTQVSQNLVSENDLEFWVFLHPSGSTQHWLESRALWLLGKHYQVHLTAFQSFSQQVPEPPSLLLSQDAPPLSQ